MNWKTILQTYLPLVIVVIAVTLITGYLISTGINRYDEFKDCLEPIAKSVCEERQQEYSYHNTQEIWCKEDIRQDESQRYLYTKEEIKECQKQ